MHGIKSSVRRVEFPDPATLGFTRSVEAEIAGGLSMIQDAQILDPVSA